jgi:VanZ family protein
VLKKLLLLASIIYTAALVLVTLIDLEDIPSLGSSFDDKIYHLLAYVVLAFLWMSYARAFKSKEIIAVVFIGLLLFGVALELVQHQINANRTYDIIDLLSNCVGVALGTFIARLFNVFKLNIFKALLFLFFIN